MVVGSENYDWQELQKVYIHTVYYFHILFPYLKLYSNIFLYCDYMGRIKIILILVLVHCLGVVATLLWCVATFSFLIQHNRHCNPQVVVGHSVGTTIL